MRASAALLLMGLVAASHVPPVRTLDLARPFATRSDWRLTVTQGSDIPDPIMGSGDPVPGPLELCLSRDRGRTCDPAVTRSLRLPGADDDLYGEPHALRRLTIVHPRPGRALLLIQLGSLQSVNGNQRIATELYAYDRAADAFRTVYSFRTRRNNDEEVRYIEAGPLRGAMIAAEPTQNAPFGFWITVARAGATGRYRAVLRYRSVTRYGNGNPLAVIDSDMPATEQRLGLWRPGRLLPLPAHCPMPRLVRGELWCTPS